ncbi:MAG: gliding motility lipoprotein GldH [Ferruginibacter sp.]
MYYSKVTKAASMRIIKEILSVKQAVIFLCAIFLFSSCRNIDLFEKNTPIPGYNWKTAYPVTGNFTITDTVSAYHIYIVLRHTDAYNYNNIWLNAGLQAPGDTLVSQNINLSLGNDATGWEGVGMNDIWEVRKRVTAVPTRFKMTGEYRFNITHIMRDDPLPHIMSVGLRLEKLP